MKIISKHKDYYDYCVGKFGRDPLMVYDRRIKDSAIPKRLQNPNKIYVGFDNVFAQSIVFYICGEIKIVFAYKGNFYFSIKDVPIQAQHLGYITGLQNKPTDINLEYKQPVLMEDSCGKLSIPILNDFNFSKLYSPEEMYQKIYAFLGYCKDNNSEASVQTNKEKITSHGFDKRTSFRPKIKIAQ